MANLKRGEAEVELGGIVYTLHFGMGAIATLEEMSGGKPIDELLFSGSVSISTVIHALCAGLVKKHRVYQPKKIARMIDETLDEDPAALEKIVRAISRAVMGGRGATQAELDKFDQLMDSEEGLETSEPEGDPDPRPTSSASDPGES